MWLWWFFLKPRSAGCTQKQSHQEAEFNRVWILPGKTGTGAEGVWEEGRRWGTTGFQLGMPDRVDRKGRRIDHQWLRCWKWRNGRRCPQDLTSPRPAVPALQGHAVLLSESQLLCILDLMHPGLQRLSRLLPPTPPARELASFLHVPHCIPQRLLEPLCPCVACDC